MLADSHACSVLADSGSDVMIGIKTCIAVLSQALLCHWILRGILYFHPKLLIISNGIEFYHMRQKGMNIPMDLYKGHVVKMVKKNIRCTRPNLTEKVLQRASR